MGKILIQETDKSVMEALTIALEMEGFEVWSFTNSDDFVPLIDEVRPNIVLLDYFLDGHTCIEVCQAIKLSYPDLPVIALSCNNNIAEKYGMHGFDDCIPKPFDLNFLYDKVGEYVRAITD